MPERIYRYSQIDSAKIDREAKTVPIAFSSEYPAIQRADENVPDAIRTAAGLRVNEVYIEVLDHDSENVDLSMLNTKGAFLDEHEEKSQLGVVERAEISNDRIGRAVVRLGTDEQAAKRFSQMAEGTRPHISAGYKYTRFVRDDVLSNGRRAKRFAWKALELSSVAIPADPTIGVARSHTDLPGVDFLSGMNADDIANNLTTEQKTRMKILLDPNPAAGGGGSAAATIDEVKVRAEAGKQALTTYRERVKKIRGIADELIKDRPDLSDKLRGMAGEAENSDEEVGLFQVRAMNEVIKSKPAKQVTMEALGYDERDRQSYSLVRGIQNCIARNAQTPDPSTIEGDAHVKMSKLDLGYGSNFLVPPDANISQRSLARSDRRRMQRDMQVNIFGQGGASVATELVTPIIEILRNRMVTERLGVRVMAGLEGNVVIPRQTGAGTAYAVSEIAGLTLSNQQIDQIPISPKRVGATGQYSKQLLLQSSIDVEGFVRDDFLKVIAIDWDRLIINGQGAASEPMGIMNTPGVGSVVFGASATFAKLVAFWTQVAVANADVGDMAYITSPTAGGTLQSAAKLLVGATTVAAIPLWEGGGTEGRINGYTARATNQVPNNQMVFGVWSEIIHALWGGYDIVVDPYTLAKNGEVVVTINTWGDVAVRHPQCFCVSSDSAAQ
jgi:HK97 family phage major capsid protein